MRVSEEEGHIGRLGGRYPETKSCVPPAQDFPNTALARTGQADEFKYAGPGGHGWQNRLSLMFYAGECGSGLRKRNAIPSEISVTSQRQAAVIPVMRIMKTLRRSNSGGVITQVSGLARREVRPSR